MHEGVGEDSRLRIGYVDIQVGSCICLSVCLCFAMTCALRWGSNPCRKLSLLGFFHPIEGSLFQVQGVYRKTALTRSRV